MSLLQEYRWEAARVRTIERWREILRRIDGHDEGGVLGLANVQDEFCEEASASRAASLGGDAPPETSLLKFDPGSETIGTRCLFCRAFQESGGCFVLLSSLNRLVLSGSWDEAARIARTYLGRLESMDLDALAGPAIH